MSECTVQLWYNKQRPKKDGTVSLYLQIIVGREHDEVQLKHLNWPMDKVDWKTKTLKPRSADDQEINSFNAIIERERAKYWNVIMGFLKRNVSFTLTDVFREVNLYKDGHLLCAYMEYAIKARLKSENSKERLKESSAKPHRSTLKSIQQYLNNIDVEITSVNAAWMAKYAEHLRKTLCENTVWARIKDVKTYLSYAANHFIEVDKDYKRFSITKEDTDPTWLEDDELNRLLDLYQDPNLNTEQKRNLRAFLFACFTGLRVSDLSRWSKDWIIGNHIVFVPQKRRYSKKPPKPLKIPILPIAWEFISDLDTENFEIPCDQAYNRAIKEFSLLAGINKVFTTHVARHTFATSLALLGVPEIVISKLLGHKSTSATKVYMHIAESYKALEMMKLQKRFGRRVASAQPPAGPSGGLIG